jgi:hypothetical protein
MLKLNIFILPFLFQLLMGCKSEPITEVKSIETEFQEYENKLNNFYLQNNGGKRRTRDPEVVKSFFTIGSEFIDFAEENYSTYQENFKLLEDKSLKMNKYLSFKKVSYQYSRRRLSDVENMIISKINKSKNYHYTLNLSAARIFKLRPPGQKPGGSKKYDSIRKTFN